MLRLPAPSNPDFKVVSVSKVRGREVARQIIIVEAKVGSIPAHGKKQSRTVHQSMAPNRQFWMNKDQSVCHHA
jgi:hypothetical protein